MWHAGGGAVSTESVHGLGHGCGTLGFARGKFFVGVVEVLAAEPPIAKGGLTAPMHRFQHRQQLLGGHQIAGNAGSWNTSITRSDSRRRSVRFFQRLLYKSQIVRAGNVV